MDILYLLIPLSFGFGFLEQRAGFEIGESPVPYDANASYGAIMKVMDDLREVQIENVGLITDPKTPRSAAPAGGGR